MTSRDFCFWLQGMFELARPNELNAATTATIRKHLALVFVHEIDPSAGSPEHQAELDAIHEGDVNPTGASTKKPKPNPEPHYGPGGPVFRC